MFGLFVMYIPWILLPKKESKNNVGNSRKISHCNDSANGKKIKITEKFLLEPKMMCVVSNKAEKQHTTEI